MQNLPTDIQHKISNLDKAWNDYKQCHNRAEFQAHQNNIINAKNNLINCLTKEFL